jgi:aspartate kinase
MLIYKFGGASVKDAEGVKILKGIVDNCHQQLVVVVSAMGKTTNALELIVENYFAATDYLSLVSDLKVYHTNLISKLFGSNATSLTFEEMWKKFELELEKSPSMNFDFDYDRIVSFGELFSTAIIADYLNHTGSIIEWKDARKIIRTSNQYREGKILWDVTESQVVKEFTFNNTQKYITQGFLGSTTNNLTTTLGREGSDYSAATFGYLLNAHSVTIWKDVPGVLNADPKWFAQPQLLPELTYREAIELTFYGAHIIHPKTLKPLQNKGIPLYVKSFLNPGLPGTKIYEDAPRLRTPVYIRKENQVLVSIYPTDFSFIVEDNIRDIFNILSQNLVKVNLMQNSALSFSLCITYDKRRFPELIDALKREFKVVYNLNVQLLTIRHFMADGVFDMLSGHKVLMEQKTRNTACFVLDVEKI